MLFYISLYGDGELNYFHLYNALGGRGVKEFYAFQKHQK
jgi:hypothetical protein